MPLVVRLLFSGFLIFSVLFGSPLMANDKDDKPYLLLVSIDGFRWDYLDQYDTPAMNALAARGIRAQALLPVFPTLTFPNHYSTATGLYPQNHGIVANVFPDPERGELYVYKEAESAQDGSWYGGEPIWVAAKKAGMNTAAFYFVGTEADIQGIRPDRWNAYDKSVTGDQRVDQVLEWLGEPEETRPQVISLYFDDVDDQSHWNGVGSKQAVAAIGRVDGYLQRLVDGIEKLPYKEQLTMVVVSDHGQGSYTQATKPYVLEDHFNLDGILPIESGSYLFLHFEKEDPARILSMQEAINQQWDCGRAYRPEDTPADWHVGDNPRFPDLILTPDPGCAALSRWNMADKINAGDHGWAPEMPEMHGIFIAAGPGLPAGLRIPALRNVDVYPLLLRQLGLPQNQNVDSNLALWPELIGPAMEPKH